MIKIVIKILNPNKLIIGNLGGFMDILKTTLVGLFFGTFGTTLGGILGVVIKKDSNKFLSFILSIASRANDVYYLF